MMDEKGQSKVSMTVVILVAVLMLVVGGIGAFVLTQPGAIAGQEAQVDQDVSPQNVSCDLGDDDITFQILRVSPDGAKADVTSDYNVDVRDQFGVTKSSGSATSTHTLSKLKSYTVHAIDADSTHDVYYFNHSFATDCSESETIVIEKGVEDTALSTTMYTRSGGDDTTNTVSAVQTIGAGASAKGRVYIEATTANGAWGTANGGREFKITLDYNNSVYKQPTIVSVSDGSVSEPKAADGSYSRVVSSSTQDVAFIITTDALVDLGNLSVEWEAEAKSAITNPSSTDGNIGITIDDKEGYLNDSLTYSVGYDDIEDGSDIGEAVVTDTHHVE